MLRACVMAWLTMARRDAEMLAMNGLSLPNSVRLRAAIIERPRRPDDCLRPPKELHSRNARLSRLASGWLVCRRDDRPRFSYTLRMSS